jgi:hypothetical protein
MSGSVESLDVAVVPTRSLEELDTILAWRRKRLDLLSGKLKETRSSIGYKGYWYDDPQVLESADARLAAAFDAYESVSAKVRALQNAYEGMVQARSLIAAQSGNTSRVAYTADIMMILQAELTLDDQLEPCEFDDTLRTIEHDCEAVWLQFVVISELWTKAKRIIDLRVTYLSEVRRDFKRSNRLAASAKARECLLELKRIFQILLRDPFAVADAALWDKQKTLFAELDDLTVATLNSIMNE